MAKVIFLHLFVILFPGGGVSASVHAGIPHITWEQTPPRSRPPPPRADTPPEQTPTPRSRHPPLGADTPSPGSRLRHMGNERPVHILLECILVILNFNLHIRAPLNTWGEGGKLGWSKLKVPSPGQISVGGGVPSPRQISVFGGGVNWGNQNSNAKSSPNFNWGGAGGLFWTKSHNRVNWDL